MVSPDRDERSPPAGRPSPPAPLGAPALIRSPRVPAPGGISPRACAAGTGVRWRMSWTTCSAVRRFSWACAVGSSRCARTGAASGLDVVGQYVLAAGEGGGGLHGAQQVQGGARRGAEAQVRVGAGGGDQVDDVAADGLGDVHLADGLDELHDVVRVRHGGEVVERESPPCTSSIWSSASGLG
ncbi:hypothetical protein GCM10020254_60430 [Streptomyces goshikiensis]